MSQTKIIIGLLIGVVVVGGGFFALKSMPSGAGVVVAPIEKKLEKKIAFSEFIKKGGSYKCTVQQGVGGVDTKGTTYINDGMVRGEYKSQMQGMSMDSVVIVRDGYTYSWSSMLPNRGFKTKMVESTTTVADPSMAGSYSFNAEQIGEYNCDTWVLDSTLFDLPSSTVFTEIK
jgi:hypothetical protein